MSHRVRLTILLALLATGPSLNAYVLANSGAESLTRSTVRSVELRGAVRIGGRAASNVRLTFQHSGGVQREWRARIRSDGTYRVKLQGADTGRICARIERNRPLNSYSKCRQFSAGAHRLDFDLPSGLIRVEIPASRGRGADLASVRVESAHDSAGRSFKLAKGFRGDYFGAASGTYVITVIDPEHERLLASWPVTLTPDEPVVGIKLGIAPNKISRSHSPTH